MQKLRMIYYPSPILTTKCELFDDIDEGLKVGDELKHLLREKSGLGFAANQAGLLVSVIVVAFPNGDGEFNDLRTVVNPQILWESPEKVYAEEGCLSFPGLYIELPRAKQIVLGGFVEGVGETRMDASGLLARIILHETDHINGIPFINRIIEPVRREMIQPELDRIARKYGNGGDE